MLSVGNNLLPTEFFLNFLLSFSTKYHLNKYHDYYIMFLERFAKGVGKVMTGYINIAAHMFGQSRAEQSRAEQSRAWL